MVQANTRCTIWVVLALATLWEVSNSFILASGIFFLADIIDAWVGSAITIILATASCQILPDCLISAALWVALIGLVIAVAHWAFTVEAAEAIEVIHISFIALIKAVGLADIRNAVLWLTICILSTIAEICAVRGWVLVQAYSVSVRGNDKWENKY